jgi:ferric-chelate reductase (NADPH)
MFGVHMPAFKTTVLSALGGTFLPQATVTEIDVISSQFRLISLNCDKFKQAPIQPASKIRLNPGNWELRAYTPLSIDTQTGRMQILAYLHGDGPGGRWARSAKQGNLTHVLGPQTSLDLIGHSKPAVFFGDETSFAAAKTLQTHLAPDHATRLIFEVTSVVEAESVIERLGLRYTQCFERQPGEEHITAVTDAIRNALGNKTAPYLVLTGNGRSIQSIRTLLRKAVSGVIDYRVKAYWAPGKTGLE